MMAAEPTFLDTSFIVAVTMENHPHHRAASDHFETLIEHEAELFICPQVCREFVVALTRGPFGDVKVSLDDALLHLDDWLVCCTVLDEHAGVLREWLRLVDRYKVHGKQVHDCNIVAVMKCYGLKRLATRNADDFKRFDLELDSIA